MRSPTKANTLNVLNGSLIIHNHASNEKEKIYTIIIENKNLNLFNSIQLDQTQLDQLLTNIIEFERSEPTP